MIHTTSVCALLVLAALSSPSAAWISMPPNDYVDTVLRSALQFESQSSQLDPLPLFDFRINFNDHVPVIGTVNGQVNFTDGQLSGLSKVRRDGDCKGPFYGVSAAFMNCTLVFDNLQVVYNGKLKYGKLPAVSIKAKANMTSTALYVDILSYPQSPVPVLRYYRFLQIGFVETKFSGLGSPLNRALTILDERFRSRVWSAFFNAIGQDFQFSLSRAISRVPLPSY